MLTQRQVAEILGVTESSIWKWESNESRPFWRHWGPIKDFLGYDPFPPAPTLAGKLASARKLQGLPQKEAARRLGVDTSTLARWERGKGKHSKRLRRLLELSLAGNGCSLLRRSVEVGEIGHGP